MEQLKRIITDMITIKTMMIDLMSLMMRVRMMKMRMMRLVNMMGMKVRTRMMRAYVEMAS